LNKAKAEAAITALGSRIGLNMVDTAYGIHLIANSNMMRALNGVSSERGRDPSQFALFAIGGNGSVHGTKLADDLRMRTVIVPPAAGVFSALGMLFTDVEHQVIRAYYRKLDEIDPAAMSALLAQMTSEARRLLADSGFEGERQEVRCIAELRYFGQMTTLAVPITGVPVTADVLALCRKEFTRLHELNYGYSSPDEKLQFVALKVIGRGLSDMPRVPSTLISQRREAKKDATRKVYFGPDLGWLDTAVVSRASLTEKPRRGPLVVEEYESTSVVRPGWSVEVDGWSNIVMRRAQ
jgi:N-methylhydantoinase A